MSKTKIVPVRFSQDEYNKMKTFCELAGVTISEYIRHSVSENAVTVSVNKVDHSAINELRRQGGLLKSNFELLRAGQAPKNIFVLMESVLLDIKRTIKEVGNGHK